MSSNVPTVVEALHNDAHLAQNLSLRKVSGSNYFHPTLQPQILISVAPKKVNAEKPAIVAATTTTTDVLVLRSNSQSQRFRKISGDDGPEVSNYVLYICITSECAVIECGKNWQLKTVMLLFGDLQSAQFNNLAHVLLPV